MEEQAPQMVDVPKMIFEDRYQDDDTMSVSTNMVESSDGSDGREVIGAEESQRVKISRIIMFLILGTAATGFGLLTWFYTTGQEDESFETTVSTINPMRT